MAVIREKMLNFASLAGNNNKFYNIKIEDGASYEVQIHYGRVGTSGQRTSKSFGSIYQAESFYEKKLSEKLNKGYVEVELTRTTSRNVTSNPQGKTSDKDIKNTKQVDAETAKVYSMLLHFVQSSRHFVKHNINSPLGSLTDNQIRKGYEILDRIERVLKNGVTDKNTLISLSDEFYRVFPIVFGTGRGSRYELVIDNLGKLGDKRQLVDVAKSVTITNELDSIEEVYDSLKMKIKPLKKTTKKYSEIIDRVARTHSNKHNFTMNVKNVYEIEKPEWDDRFNPYKCRVNLLYHGSRTENFLNILQQGLKIKPPGAAHSGSMFGNGIYFADQSSKSANYCWGFNRQKGTYYMMVCEVAVGKMYDLQSSDSSLRSAPRGYNSVRGVVGPHLYHNEIIVYNENQANIRYIIEFEV